MSSRRILFLSASALALAAFLAVSLVTIQAQQPAGAAVKIKDNDIGGVVTGSKGPEAGVWVIAETNDLGTKYSKTVVTDDRGRYLIPELPKADLHGVGARLRAGGFGENENRAGEESEPYGGDCTERESGGGILSVELLVRAGAASGEERVSGHGAGGERD